MCLSGMCNSKGEKIPARNMWNLTRQTWCDTSEEMKVNSRHVRSPTSVPWKQTMVKEEKEYLRSLQWHQSPECTCSKSVHYYSTPWWVLHRDNTFPIPPPNSLLMVNFSHTALPSWEATEVHLHSLQDLQKCKWFSVTSNRRDFFFPRDKRYH